jgi:hypothetical protein
MLPGLPFDDASDVPTADIEDARYHGNRDAAFGGGSNNADVMFRESYAATPFFLDPLLLFLLLGRQRPLIPLREMFPGFPLNDTSDRPTAHLK